MSEFCWHEFLIANALCRQTFAQKCVLLVDRCKWTGHECDVMGVTADLRIIDVEIKVSRADLRADAYKDKWWHRFGSVWQNGALVERPPTAREWPTRVWKHYYAMPADIWKPELLDVMPSPSSGVILMGLQGVGNVCVANVVRRARPNPSAYRLKPEQVMDVARLANLRMWDAYSRRQK